MIRPISQFEKEDFPIAESQDSWFPGASVQKGLKTIFSQTFGNPETRSVSVRRTGDRCSKTVNQSLCFLLSLGSRLKQIILNWSHRFPVAVAGGDVLRSGLPVDELLAAAEPITAKPSKLPQSGSEGRGERYTALPPAALY